MTYLNCHDNNFDNFYSVAEISVFVKIVCGSIKCFRCHIYLSKLFLRLYYIIK